MAIPEHDLGNYIRVERERRGWTQEQLAERLGVSRQSVYMLEAGRTKRLQRSTKEALLRVLGTDVDKPETQTPTSTAMAKAKWREAFRTAEFINWAISEGMMRPDNGLSALEHHLQTLKKAQEGG